MGGWIGAAVATGLAVLLLTLFLPKDDDPITRAMVRNGWDALWYANPCSKGERSDRSAYGPRWHAGIWWVSPDGGELVCIDHPDDYEEAERLLSPGGWTPEEAVELAEKKLKKNRRSNA